MMPANRNALWAQLFVDELARCGLQAASMAPGSRSTPLVLAFAAQQGIRTYVHADERSAAFFALGLALTSRRPVAMLCTSGTAAANFHPAVIEAYQAQIPLLVLTADRPHDQRDSGANQTIDQVKMYADHVLWSAEVAPPEASPPDRTLRYLRTLACRALAISDGLRKGPVHLNFPFRKPLENVPVPGDVPNQWMQDPPPGYGGRADRVPYTRIERGSLTPSDEGVEQLTAQITSNRKGLIVCGPRCPGGAFPEKVARLSALSGYPILADALSGVRFGPHVAQENATILGGYETFLPHLKEKPELLLRFGAMPISKRLEDFLGLLVETPQVGVSAHGVWEDPTFGLGKALWAEPELVCKRVVDCLQQQSHPADRRWALRWQALERSCWQASEGALDQAFMEETVLMDVARQMPPSGVLYVASSLPVRHLDQFVKPDRKPLRALANRGASGIDGTTSSALGAVAADMGPVVLVTGDLAFYHDLSGLLAAKRYGLRLMIVLLNNDGGGIFHRLPIAQFEPPFTELFLTPHGLRFEHIARAFELEYRQATSRGEFQAAFEAALSSPRSSLIEVPFDAKRNHQQHLEIIEATRKAME